MHEWALAEAVLTAALKEAEQEGLHQIAEITLRIGELQQIEREIFEFALREAMPPHTPQLAEVTFRLETEPAEFQCRACEHTWLLADSLLGLTHEEQEAIHFLPETAHVYLKCPACQSPDFSVAKGRGVSLVAVSGTAP